MFMEVKCSSTKMWVEKVMCGRSGTGGKRLYPVVRFCESQLRPMGSGRPPAERRRQTKEGMRWAENHLMFETKRVTKNMSEELETYRRRQEARKVGSCLLGKKDVGALSLGRRKDSVVERTLNSQDLSKNLEMEGVVFLNLGRGKSLRFRAIQKDGENNLTVDLEASFDTDGSVGEEGEQGTERRCGFAYTIGAVWSRRGSGIE